MVIFSKRGQFFMLAAVIISAIVLSFGAVVNKASSNNEADNFKDYTFEVKRETGAVLDYAIYTVDEGNPDTFASADNIDKFVKKLGNDLRDRDPDANFVFIYGTNKIVNIVNRGTGDVEVNGDVQEGSDVEKKSKIFIEFTSTSVTHAATTFDPNLAKVSTGCGIECSAAKSQEINEICDTRCESLFTTNVNNKNLCSSYCKQGKGSVYEEAYNNKCGSCATESFAVNVSVSGQDLNFNFGDSPQIVFIIQKEVGDDNYVAAG